MAASACTNPVIELEYPELEAVPRDVPEQTFVYDADGEQLAVLRREFRERVELDRIPRVVVDAVIAAEDRRFYDHAGIDARAIVRAGLRNVAAGEIQEGGSTITQQLVKNLYLPEAPRTPETKLEEAILARQLESEQDKEWILEEYLNTVYFGNGAYGVQAASETYWRVDVADLDLAQAALLAALIRAPESLDPEDTPEAARAQRDRVLETMVRLGSVTEPAAAAAREQPVDVLPRPPTPESRERHWVDFVIRTLLRDPSFGGTEAERAARLYGGGLRIHTTLRPELQRAARTAISDHLADPGHPDAAVVTVDPTTGHILAAASVVPYEELQFDLATQARRQPGSTFKTFVLVAALTQGWRPDDRIPGGEIELETPRGPWRVRNYGRASYGEVTLDQATRSSINGAFARLILTVGPGRVAALARAMGVTSPVEDHAPIALGGTENCCTPLDMAAAYATLANLGARVPATPVDRIEDADGNVVWRPSDVELPVVDPSVAYVTTQMLRDAVVRGTGVRGDVRGWEVAGKTGTVTGYVDAWFVGYTATLATSVWVGHREGRIAMHDVRGFRQVTGGSIPAHIWREYMTVALGDDPVAFTLPEEHYRTVEIDPETGLRSAPWCPGEPSPVPRILVPEETCPSPAPSPSPTATQRPCPTVTAGTPAPSPTPRPEGCPPSPQPTGDADDDGQGPDDTGSPREATESPTDDGTDDGDDDEQGDDEAGT